MRTLIASNQKELLHFINRLKTISQEYGLQTNGDKTKIMIVDRENQQAGTDVPGTNVPSHMVGECEIVDSFIYLRVRSLTILAGL